MRRGQDVPSAEHKWFQRAPMDPLHGTTECHSQVVDFYYNAAKRKEKKKKDKNAA